MGFKLYVDSQNLKLSKKAYGKQRLNTSAESSTESVVCASTSIIAAPTASVALIAPGAAPTEPVASTSSAALGAPAALTLQPLPVGFPLPPAGYELLFNSWASQWRRINGNRDVDYRIVGELRTLVDAVETSIIPSSERPSRLQLSIREELASNCQQELNLIRQNIESEGKAAYASATRNLKEALKELEKAQDKYEKAIERRRETVGAPKDKLQTIRERITKLLGNGTSTQPRAGVDEKLRQRSLSEGLIPVWVKADKAPSLHSRFGSVVPRTVRCSPEINIQVMDLYWQSMELYDIQSIRITPRQPREPGTGQCPRYLENEGQMDPFFKAELVKPAAAIIKQLHPAAKVRGEPGNRTFHADYFLVVTLEVPGDSGDPQECCSAIAVEFKIPYGVDKQPAATQQAISSLSTQASGDSSDSFYCRQRDHSLKRAGLPSLVYGRHALVGQLCHYVRGTVESEQPNDWVIRQQLCREFGILTDFNRTWVVHFAPASGERGNSEAGDFGIEISEPFHAANGSPHPAFAYVYILDQVIRDMEAHPSEYRVVQAPLKRQVQQASGKPRKRPAQGRKRVRSSSRMITRALAKKQRAISAPKGFAEARGYGLVIPQLQLLASNCHTSAKVELLDGCPLTSPTETLVLQMKGSDPVSSAEESGSSAEAHLLSLAQSDIWGEDGCRWQPLKGNIVIGRPLGSGRSGVVCAGQYNSVPAAFKCCPASARKKIVNEIVNEAVIYGKLEALQGNEIPKLLDKGILVIQDELYVVLVLESIQDCFADKLGDRESILRNELTIEQRRAAIDVVGRIHQLGVCHGDPRVDNILFESDGHNSRVPKVIDFAFSFADSSTDEIKGDLAEWRSVLEINF
ncbi:hypothetical protein LPJ78_005715 [Coemansia sp. RSA 989]|nr:hypothetical protein LPJ78_005715 [Coemansia sp. RSA 989]